MSRLIFMAIVIPAALAGCVGAAEQPTAAVPPPSPQPSIAVTTMGTRVSGNALYLQGRELVVRTPLGTQIVALDKAVETSGQTVPAVPPASCPPIDLTPRQEAW